MMKIWPCDDEESERFPIFTRANTGEVFAVAATPLTWSVLGQQVYENGYRDALYEMGASSGSPRRSTRASTAWSRACGSCPTRRPSSS